jgi:hypothetical protein
MHNDRLLLLRWFPFVVSEPSSWALCMHTTQAGSAVTGTVLLHTYCSCAGSVIGSCIRNHTIYLVCAHGKQQICFNPAYRPREQRLETRSTRNPGTSSAAPRLLALRKQRQRFDARAAIDHGGGGGPGCGRGGVT